jgi:hypothetical protein
MRLHNASRRGHRRRDQAMLTVASCASRQRTIGAVSSIFICLLVFQPCGCTFADAKGMSEVDAVHLLLAYLRSQGYDTKEYPLEIDRMTDVSDKGFYEYDIHAAGRHDYLGHIGTYAVNAETGDIWDTGLCQRLDTTAIAPLEELIRDNIGPSKSELERLGKKKPSCLND